MTSKKKQDEGAPETVPAEQVNSDARIIPAAMTEANIQKPHKSWRAHKKAIVLTVVGLIIVVGGSIAYSVFWKSDDSKKTTFTTSANKKIINDNLSSQTGLDLAALQTQTINTATYKDFNQAYQGALALYGVGSFSKAFQSFQIADSKGGGGYQFYQSYAAAADAVNNSTLGTQLLERALDLVSKDTSLPADIRADQVQSLTALINTRKSG